MEKVSLYNYLKLALLATATAARLLVSLLCSWLLMVLTVGCNEIAAFFVRRQFQQLWANGTRLLWHHRTVEFRRRLIVVIRLKI